MARGSAFLECRVKSVKTIRKYYFTPLGWAKRDLLPWLGATEIEHSVRRSRMVLNLFLRVYPS